MKRITLAAAAALALALVVALPAAAEDTPKPPDVTCADAVPDGADDAPETDGSDTKDGSADWPEHQTSGQQDDDGQTDPEGAPDLTDGEHDKTDGSSDFPDFHRDPPGEEDSEDTEGDKSTQDGPHDRPEHQGAVDGDSDDNREGSLDREEGAADRPENADGSDQPEKDGSDTPETDGSDTYEEGDCAGDTTPQADDTNAPTETPGGSAPAADGAAAPAGFVDKDCDELSQQQARDLLAQDPSDPNRLDADDDGRPCESSSGTAQVAGTNDLAYTGAPALGWLIGAGAALLTLGTATLLLARLRARRSTS